MAGKGKKKRAAISKPKRVVARKKAKPVLKPKAEKKPIIEKHTGIRTLIFYTILLAFFYVFYLFFTLQTPTVPFLGKFVKGAAAVAINIAFIAVLIFVIYGFLKKRAWVWKLALVWFGFGIINSLLTLIIIWPQKGLIKELMFLSSVVIILVNGLVIWYLAQIKDYFVKPKHPFHYGTKDKVFVYLLLCIWVFILALSIVNGVKFYNSTTAVIDSTIEELEGASLIHSIVICEQKEGEERDICLMIVATMYRTENIGYVCEKIESDFYETICLQSIK